MEIQFNGATAIRGDNISMCVVFYNLAGVNKPPIYQGQADYVAAMNDTVFSSMPLKEGDNVTLAIGPQILASFVYGGEEQPKRVTLDEIAQAKRCCVDCELGQVALNRIADEANLSRKAGQRAKANPFNPNVHFDSYAAYEKGWYSDLSMADMREVQALLDQELDLSNRNGHPLSPEGLVAQDIVLSSPYLYRPPTDIRQ